MGKKDKKKEKMSDALAEGIIELILTIIVGGLGFIICLGVSKLFSFKIDELDLDTFVLIGIAFLAIVIFVISVIKKIIKSIGEKNKQQTEICCETNKLQISK